MLTTPFASGTAGGVVFLRFVSGIARWFLLLEIFPTTLSLAEETHQVSEVLLRQGVLVAGHVRTAGFNFRCDCLIVNRLSRYQSGTFVEISQRRGGGSGCSRIVVVANPALIEVNFFSALGTTLGKPLKVQNLCGTLEIALRRIRRTSFAGLLNGEQQSGVGGAETQKEDHRQYPCVLHTLLQRLDTDDVSVVVSIPGGYGVGRIIDPGPPVERQRLGK